MGSRQDRPQKAIDPKVVLAHYRGVLAALEDAQAMNRGRGGGGGKPPKKGGCLPILILFIASATIMSGLLTIGHYLT